MTNRPSFDIFKKKLCKIKRLNTEYDFDKLNFDFTKGRQYIRIHEIFY
jgi:hypothetical protein